MAREVSDKELAGVLRWFRDLRAWGLREGIDSWAVRQGLIIALAFDTQAALDRGISRDDLGRFDMIAFKDAQKYARALKGPRGS